MAIAPVSLSPAAAESSAPDRRDWTVVLCLMSVCFLFNIEGTIVTVAIPHITRDLDLSSVESALMASLYYIGMTVVLAPVTVLAARYCVKRMLLVSLVVFTAGAVVAWRAESVPMLLAARALQGMGGGGMAAMAYGSVGVWFKPARIGWAYGLVNAAIGCGMLLGAPLGGILVSASGWSSIFSATAVVSVIVLGVCAALLPAAFHTPVGTPFLPRLGRAVVLGLGVSGAVYAVSKVGESGLGAVDVRIAGALGCIGLAVTLLSELRSTHPLVPHEVWRGGREALALAVVACVRGLLVISNFTVPFLLGVVFGCSTAVTGGLMAISAGIFALSSPRGAALAQRIGPSRVVSLAMTANTAAFLVLAYASRAGDAPIAVVAVALGFVGLGSGLAVASASRGAVEAIPQAFRGTAGMLLPTAGFVGMAAYVTVSEWIFAWRVEGGFSVVERAHDASVAEAARGGFAAVFAAAALVSVAAALVAQVARRFEQRGA